MRASSRAVSRTPAADRRPLPKFCVEPVLYEAWGPKSAQESEDSRAEPYQNQPSPQDGPRWPQDGPKVARRWPQDGPKMSQNGPKMAQHGPKMAPRWPRFFVPALIAETGNPFYHFFVPAFIAENNRFWFKSSVFMLEYIEQQHENLFFCLPLGSVI